MTTKTLLLVEDNPTDEKLSVRAFAKCAAVEEIVVVRDGAEALEYMFGTGRYEGRFVGDTPRVILLDLRLPKVSGHEVIERLRADLRTRLVPIVVLTASKEPEDVVRAYTLGACAYVRKPVDYPEFVEVARTIGEFWCGANVPAPAPTARLDA